MKNAITLDALRTIEAINLHGSFAAAAKALFKVPSALTYTVAKLESDLNVALFDRSKQRAVLTPAGKLVLEQGRELLRATSALEESVQQLETGWETHLTITLDTLVPMSVIFSLFGEFTQLDKMTELTVKEEVLSGAWESLLSKQAQIVVGVSGEFPKGNFNVIEIAQIEFCFTVAAFHPLAQQTSIITNDDIKKYPSIVVADSATSYTRRTTGLLDSRQAIRVSNMTAKVTAQEMGLGIGFLPKHLIKDQLANGSLIIKECEVPRHPEFIYMAWRKDFSGLAQYWFTKKLQTVDWTAVFS